MQPPLIEEYLKLERCPHCSVHKPTLKREASFATMPEGRWIWYVYVCQGCKYPMVAGGQWLAKGEAPRAALIIPKSSEIDEAVPEPARRYLKQASEALHTPDGATMLAASAVDALLKAKGYRKGWLSERIKQAAAEHVITEDMAAWAHHVRLEANDPRHADAVRPHATREEAEQTLEFALALAQFLFVLPARVARGMRAAVGTATNEGGSGKRTKPAGKSPSPARSKTTTRRTEVPCDIPGSGGSSSPSRHGPTEKETLRCGRWCLSWQLGAA
jgi:Domain of unknown function (DUF4145)